MPASRTPAFAKPKSDTMRKALQGAKACSRICNGLSTASGAPGDLRNGIIMAAMTPATVACTPDSSTARSEERRVGQECARTWRARGSTDHETKKNKCSKHKEKKK